MGLENSLINDILKKIILALLEPFFYFIIIIILFLSGKKLRLRWVFSYCTASSPPKIWPRLPESHSGHWTIKTMIIRELIRLIRIVLPLTMNIYISFLFFVIVLLWLLAFLKLPSKWYYQLLRVAQFLKQTTKNTEQSKLTVTG